jgi:hypothetical protein
MAVPGARKNFALIMPQPATKVFPTFALRQEIFTADSD